MGIDTNCHSKLFGETTNKRGLDFEELVIENGLHIENLGTEPTYEVVRGDKLIQTCIDATLSKNIDDNITDWEVRREYNGSDHNTITFTLRFTQEPIKAERNWNKGEWTLLKPLLDQEEYYEPKIVTEKKLDQCVYQMYKKLNRALDQVCPKKKRRTRIKGNPWYNKRLRILADKVKKAYKNSKRLLGESKIFYKKLVAKYKKLCKQRRRASWRKYKETRQMVSDIVKLNKIIQKKQTSSINTFKREDGTNTSPGEETLSALTSTHFPNATKQINKKYTSKNSLSRNYICLLYTSPSPRD